MKTPVLTVKAVQINMPAVPDEQRGSRVYSEDLTHGAYAQKVGEKVQVIVDGKTFGPYDQATNVRLSPTGGRFGFAAVAGGKTLVIIDGVQVDAVAGPDWIRSVDVEFSRDGKHVAYVVGQRGEQWVVADGKKHATYGQIMRGMTRRAMRGRTAFSHSAPTGHVSRTSPAGSESSPSSSSSTEKWSSLLAAPTSILRAWCSVPTGSGSPT